MVELLLWIAGIWVLCFVACAFLRSYIGARWRRIAALALVPSVMGALALVFFAPPFGGYGDFAARYWMSRAAGESDAAAKESLVRRVALTSPNHGWYTASTAIATVGSATQRCRLRTILAGLSEVRNRERLGNEARDECNAALPQRPS